MTPHEYLTRLAAGAPFDRDLRDAPERSAWLAGAIKRAWLRNKDPLQPAASAARILADWPAIMAVSWTWGARNRVRSLLSAGWRSTSAPAEPKKQARVRVFPRGRRVIRSYRGLE